MTGLLIPSHVARAADALAARLSSPITLVSPGEYTDDASNNAAETSVTIYSVDRPLPEVVPQKIHPYRMYVMLVGLKRELGGILLPDETIDAQYFNHCLGRIVGLGPSCFKGHRWEDIGYTQDMHPKVGDFITFNPRAPIRETWSKTILIVMNDDDWRSSPSREEINHLTANTGY